PDVVKTSENLIEVTVGEMEFLGSFWRTRLRGGELGDEILIADFSVNATRRLGLAEGGALTVELPADRLLVFPQGERHGGGN
ncbi:TOBE domain-containing protein, partial [Mesorhizobium sp. M7A.F.Ca.US.006.01.2.1]